MQKLCSLSLILSSSFLLAIPAPAQTAGQKVFGRTDPEHFSVSEKSHRGIGSLRSTILTDSITFGTNLIFISNGLLMPKSSIGEHLHRNMEEMFIAFDRPARFSLNGHSAELPAGSMVLCNAGSYHGVYNPSDQPIKFMVIGVAMKEHIYDSLEFGNDLVNTRLESPAPFTWAQIDRGLLHPAPHAHGGAGDVLFRRIWEHDSFKTNWGFVDHCLLKPGTSIGYHRHDGMEEVYFVMSGRGRSTVNDKTFDVRAGDAIPCTLHSSHGIYNNSQEDLELLVVSTTLVKGEYDNVNWGDDLRKR
jgi:mannose-6-phosphate isomerase-like protein (cupin superfamily)